MPHPLKKPLRRSRGLRYFHARLRNCSRSYYLLLLPFLFLFLIPIQFRAGPIGTTSAGTPLLPLPKPYGYAKDVMRVVLARVENVVLGGSAVNHNVLLESVDKQHMHGRLIGHDPETRAPHWKPTPFDFEKETLDMKKQAHAKTCFNKRRSESLSLDREVPDVRPNACKSQWYYRTGTDRESWWRGGKGRSVNLPNTSIVFVFYNEPLSTLLRAVHSVLNRTPPHLLHEILLVDDGSDEDAPWILEGGLLEEHLQLLPKTRIVRLKGRNGLMLARNAGASVATGDTITFLDSHIEVGPGWIEPLMGRIAEGEREGINRVVVPVIDNIDADTFAYNAGGIDVLGHTWGLGQTGIATTYEKGTAKPMRSPIMAGGLLSLSRRYFDQLGFYDPDMHLWGGEEMEISFRIWLCGGTLECIPCSRVGHVFRSSKYWQGQVYKVPGEVIARNKVRASFWMDDYAQLALLSVAPSASNRGSMAYYENIKKRLKCKPYRWYLENVYPQMLKSADKLLANGKFIAEGYLKNNGTETCLDHLHHRGDGLPFGVYPCHYMRGSQAAVFTKEGLLLSGENLLDGCLSREDDSRLKKRKCKDGLESQHWDMEQRTNGVWLRGNNKCLTVINEPEIDGKSPYRLHMQECIAGDEKQIWTWEKLNKSEL